jgi:hypothetical protein
MKKFLMVEVNDSNTCEGCPGFLELENKALGFTTKKCMYKPDYNSLHAYTERPIWCPLIDMPVMGNDEILCPFCDGQGRTDNCGPNHFVMACFQCRGTKKYSVTKYYKDKYDQITIHLQDLINGLKNETS